DQRPKTDDQRPSLPIKSLPAAAPLHIASTGACHPGHPRPLRRQPLDRSRSPPPERAMSTTQTRPVVSPFVPPEPRSGLQAREDADPPDPPPPTGVGCLAGVGPGVIVLGVARGGGEFLLGPAAFVRYGLSLMWVTTVAVIRQVLFNME